MGKDRVSQTPEQDLQRLEAPGEGQEAAGGALGLEAA